jgi:hypothetical protein
VANRAEQTDQKVELAPQLESLHIGDLKISIGPFFARDPHKSGLKIDTGYFVFGQEAEVFACAACDV